ncbi:hypothetical protein Q7C36_006576 [Tachysurus vachellii]|uniref:Uncharacterized protein n=1 Tax=Tachysurus vachellii TaxID=175792 RepID=A0AA88N9N2_TACVA|nr:hypothetical protein Q7C36_006576 [Tachysurus vachellii]
MRPAIHHATRKEGEYAAEGNEQAETSPQKSNKSPPQSPGPTQRSILTELAKQWGCNQPRRPHLGPNRQWPTDTVMNTLPPERARNSMEPERGGRGIEGRREEKR